MSPRVMILAVAAFAVGTETYAFTGLLARLAGDLGVAIPTAGQLVSAFAIVYAVGAPLTASALAGVNRKHLLVAALATLSVLNLLASVMPTFGGLLVVRVMCAVAATLVMPVAAAAAAALSPARRRGRAFAVVQMGLTLAMLLGIPGGTIVGDLFGWRATFVFSASLAGLAAAATALVLPSVPGDGSSGFRALGIAGRPAVAGTLLVTAAAFTGTFSVIAYIGPVVTKITGLTGGGIGAMQVFVGVGALAGVALGGVVAEQARSPRVMAINFLVMVFTLSSYSMLMVAADPAAPLSRVALAGVIVCGAAALFSLGPQVQARLVGQAPQAGHLVLALNGSMIFLGQGLGAALGGAAIGVFGLPAVGFAGAAVAASGAVLIARAGGRTPAAAATEPSGPA